MPDIQVPEIPLPIYTGGESDKPREPMRQNLFVLSLNPRTSGGTDSADLLLYARTGAIPALTIPEQEDHYLTQRYYLHGAKYEFSTFSADFLLTMNNRNALTILLEWLSKAVQWQDPFQAGWNYEHVTKGFLFMLDPDLVPIKVYQFIRLWPTNTGEVGLDYSDGVLLRVTGTFRYDRYIPVL